MDNWMAQAGMGKCEYCRRNRNDGIDKVISSLHGHTGDQGRCAKGAGASAHRQGGKLTHRCQAQPTLAWHGMATGASANARFLGAAHDGGRAGERTSKLRARNLACRRSSNVMCVWVEWAGGLSARHRLASPCIASHCIAAAPLLWPRDRSDKHTDALFHRQELRAKFRQRAADGRASMCSLPRSIARIVTAQMPEH